jgi:hypothetical protein
MPLALCVHRDDNVATLLDDASPGPISLLGEAPATETLATEAVSRGHKIALSPLSAGAAVIKYGVTIGHATRDIPAGAWVHTHNCASRLDARSATLDRHTGAPTDTKMMGMGYDAVSVAPHFYPEIKYAVRLTSFERARALATEALAQTTVADVQRVMQAFRDRLRKS